MELKDAVQRFEGKLKERLIFLVDKRSKVFLFIPLIAKIFARLHVM